MCNFPYASFAFTVLVQCLCFTISIFQILKTSKINYIRKFIAIPLLFVYLCDWNCFFCVSLKRKVCVKSAFFSLCMRARKEDTPLQMEIKSNGILYLLNANLKIKVKNSAHESFYMLYDFIYGECAFIFYSKTIYFFGI